MDPLEQWSGCEGAAVPVDLVIGIGAELQSTPRVSRATSWASIAKSVLHFGLVNCVWLCPWLPLYTQCWLEEMINISPQTCSC